MVVVCNLHVVLWNLDVGLNMCLRWMGGVYRDNRCKDEGGIRIYGRKLSW